MDAINLLLDLKSKIYTEEDFAETATEYSDCGSARCGGDLGNFESGQMMKVSVTRDGNPSLECKYCREETWEAWRT